MSRPRLAPIAAVLEAGLAEGVAPGLSAAVLRGGVPMHASLHGDAQREPDARRLAEGDRFDLASVTKLFVASAAARLVDRGLLDLDAPAAEWVPALRGAKGTITARHLLAHSSGLPAWRPWHLLVAKDVVGRRLFLPPERRPGADEVVDAIRRGRSIFEAALAAEPLEALPGERARYSDLGFIALGFLLEALSGEPLDAVVEREVLAPLGLTRTWFLPGLDPDRARSRRTGVGFAATRRCPARGGEVLCGAVDDDNAWALGGVAGHAGLFGTAPELARLGQAWLKALSGASRWLSRETAARFVERDEATPGSERALGWDTPSTEGSTVGRRLGQGARGAVGHLGFTGTSLWVDLDGLVVCALLTNHVHPAGNDRARINPFRARFHDAVAEAVGI